MKTLTRIAASLAVCVFSTLTLAQESDTIFNDLDKNEDGLLVEDEIAESQKRFFDRLLRAGDENEDGKLSKAEYQATLKEDERPAGQPSGDRPAGRQGRGQFDPAAIFDRFDSNKDGKLEKSELPEQAKDRMGRLFDQLGKDAISKEEYTKAISGMMRNGRRPGGEGGRPGGEEFLKRLDKNNDGKLSKDELPEQMKGRMAGLFERLGKDEISFEELAKMRQQREGDRPEGQRREGDRPEGQRRESDRPEGQRRDGDRPEGERRDGDRRPEGDRDRGDRPEGRNPEMRRRGEEGDRPEGGRPGMRPGGGPAFLRVLDENEDGRISKAEALNVAKLFVELDKNDDGQLDGGELMGFEGRPGGERGGMGRRPEGDRPEGDRPRPEGDRPRPEGDRPRPEGDRGGFGPEAFLERFDENKDGGISKDEAPGRMAENFDRMDENKDGKITADEFGNMFRRGRPGGEGRPEGRERGERGESDRPQRPESE